MRRQKTRQIVWRGNVRRVSAHQKTRQKNMPYVELAELSQPNDCVGMTERQVPAGKRREWARRSGQREGDRGNLGQIHERRRVRSPQTQETKIKRRQHTKGTR